MNDPARGSVPPPVVSRRIAASALPVAIAVSLGLHGGVAATLQEMTRIPDLDFEFRMPDEVEFGMTEAMDVVMVSAAPAPAVPDETTVGEDSNGAGAQAAADAGVPTLGDGGIEQPDLVDGGPLGADALDGGVPLDAADSGPDAGPSEPRLPVANATVDGPTRIPAGAQLALRLDMRRLRESVVANDVRALIAAVPDWQELLGGSGIDPLNDLERVMIATPNRHRNRILVAGRHVHGEEFTRAVVDRMADARQTQATWSMQEGVPVAPWANAGDTSRVLAMLSPQHFTISRSEDLAVALAMAAARAERGGREEGLEDAVGPDAQLSMGPDEGLSLEIEGVHAFLMAAGNADVIPIRARLAIREVSPERVAIDGLATFPDEQLAADAITFWTRQRDLTLQSLGAQVLLGDRISVLQSFTFELNGDRVVIRGSATADDVRFGLDLVRRQFEAWARQAERRRAGTAP